MLISIFYYYIYCHYIVGFSKVITCNFLPWGRCQQRQQARTRPQRRTVRPPLPIRNRRWPDGGCRVSTASVGSRCPLSSRDATGGVGHLAGPKPRRNKQKKDEKNGQKDRARHWNFCKIFCREKCIRLGLCVTTYEKAIANFYKFDTV